MVPERDEGNTYFNYNQSRDHKVGVFGENSFKMNSDKNFRLKLLEKFSSMQSILSLNRVFSQFSRVFYLFLVLKSPFLVNLRHQYWFYYNKGVKCVCPFLTPLGIMGQPPVSIILIFIISLYFRCFSNDFDLRQFSKFSIFFGDIFWNFFLL